MKQIKLPAVFMRGGTSNAIVFRAEDLPRDLNGVEFPEAERRQLEERPLTPAIRRAIVQDHNVRPDYARIRVPVLAIYRTTTFAQALAQFDPQTEEQRAALVTGYAASRAMLEKWQSDLRAGVPDARIVELPGANLYMFLSHEADIIREIRALLADGSEAVFGALAPAAWARAAS